MRKIEPVILGIILITLVIFGGILWAIFSRPSYSKPTEYQKTDQKRPKMELLEKSFDLGKVGSAEIKTKEIVLKNAGEEPLDIRNFSTSCDCTSVVVKIGQSKSPRFSMHLNSSWRGIVAPNEQAVLEITYDPKVHPAKGEISRVVYFKTNDPDFPEMQINFKAFVE